MNLGKTLILIGCVIALAGLLLTLAGKIPYVGKLPGDIHIKREHFQLYIPLASGLLLSLAASLVLWVVSLITKK
jgi:hypothetical protein